MIDNRFPTVITFYTPTWEYATYAARLGQQCVDLGVPFYSKEYKPAENWLANTRIKPRFILESLQLLKRPVLWIDADGSLYKQPTYFVGNYPYDFAARRKQIPDGRIWHVGTMFFNYTEKALTFLAAWNNLLDDNTFDGSDELCLDILWKEHSTEFGLATDDLPETYFEMYKTINQTPRSDTVIAHRASQCSNKKATMNELRQRGKVQYGNRYNPLGCSR